MPPSCLARSMLNSYTEAAVKSTCGSSPTAGEMPGGRVGAARSATGESGMGIADEKMLAPDPALVAGSVAMLLGCTDGATVVVVEMDGLLAVCDVVFGPAVAEKNVDALSGRLGVPIGAIGPIDGEGVSKLTRGAVSIVFLIDPVSDVPVRSTCPRDVAGLESACIEDGVRTNVSGVRAVGARPEVVDVARTRLLPAAIDAFSLWGSCVLCWPEL
jgi:hypothetical protein